MEHLTHRPRPQRAGRDRGGGARPRAAAAPAALVIAGAVVVALIVWALMRLLGVAPVVGRGGDVAPVTTADVVVATVIAGVAAWVTDMLLRRAGRETWWPFIGSTALAVSMNGPSWLSDGASVIVLTCLHVVVGVVLIAGFARTGGGPPHTANPTSV
jgi:Family of unknown function (DUF6069)